MAPMPVLWHQGQGTRLSGTTHPGIPGAQWPQNYQSKQVSEHLFLSFPQCPLPHRPSALDRGGGGFFFILILKAKVAR